MQGQLSRFGGSAVEATVPPLDVVICPHCFLKHGWLWALADNSKLPSLPSITAALHGLTFQKRKKIKLVK